MDELVDNNTRKAVGEAMRLCREQGLTASNTLLGFLVRATAVMDSGKYKLSSPMSNATTRSLAEAVVVRIANQGDASLESIKMEVEVECEYIAQGKRLHEEAKEKEEQAMSQEFAITSTRFRADKDDADFFSALYRQVFRHVASAAGMEHALVDPQAESETLAALDSVFPQHGLRRFLALSREDKAAQLKELRLIVLGIRVYNKSIGKGGLGVEDPVGPFQAQAAGLVRHLKALIVEAQQELDQYELAMEAKATRLLPDEAPMPALRAVHCNRLVFLDLALFLLEQVEKGMATVVGLVRQYEHEIATVKELVGGKVAVPKEKVYPKLEALGTLHTLLLQDRRMLVVLSRVADKLAAFRSSYDPAMTIKDVEESRTTELVGALLNDEGPAPSSDPEESIRAAGSQLILWDDACEDGMEVPQLACGGFSVVTAVKRGGFLLRASAEASVVAWEGALYGFVNEEEAEAFAASPREFMTALLQLVGRTPELVRLLRLEEAVPTLRMADVVEVMATPLVVDFATQTDTHLVTKHIDKTYEWNEWALRRRVVQLANLRQKRTHSQQTDLSHFRRDSETMVWLPKESVTQTAKHSGTSMPQKKLYIQGLRGAPDERMRVNHVDIDLGQAYEY